MFYKLRKGEDSRRDYQGDESLSPREQLERFAGFLRSADQPSWQQGESNSFLCCWPQQGQVYE